MRRSMLFRRWGIIVVALMGLFPSALLAAGDGGGEAGGGLTQRMMTLVMQLGVILFAARLGNLLFERLHMPGVLGELCVGILIGPSLLGGVPLPWMPGMEEGLFHVSAAIQVGSTPVSPELYGICTVASIVLLFLVGIETDLALFMRFAVTGGLVGLGGVIVSFVSGDLLGALLLPRIMPGSFGFLHPACIFLGVMSTATSVSITARILSERKKLDSPEGVTILAGAVIDDVLGIIMLAIGIGVVSVAGKGGGVAWGAIGWIAAQAVGIWLGATVLGILVARRIGAVLKCFGGKAEIATMAFGLALIVSGLFEQAHLAMIIGAYVMGLSLSRTDIRHVIRENLQPLFLFMVPVFFVVMGMMVDIPSLFAPKILFFGLIYTLVAVLAKIVGCGLPTLLCHFNLRGAWRVGLGMVPRGEVALIVAGIGLSKGLITQDVFGVAILMTLLTTVLPPPLLVKAFNRAGSGLRRGAPQAPPLPVLKFTFPTPEATALMLNHLIEAFRKEGFFTHALDLGAGLYQVRKDAMMIGITREQNTIECKCSASEIPFVQTAMTEVIVEFELSLQELRRPLNVTDILGAGDDDALTVEHNRRLVRYLRPDTMMPCLKGNTKPDVIAELVDLLARQGHVRDAAAALEAVKRREAAMSTGLRHGFACPHGRTDAVDQLVCAIGTKPEGLPFDSLDGLPTQVVMLVLSPTAAVAPYMEFMAMMRNVLDTEGRAALLRCDTPQAMYEQLVKRRKA